MKDAETCALFLCYRGQDKSTDIAAAFDLYSKSNWKKLAASNGVDAGVKCHYSSGEPIGNYKHDIPTLLSESDFMIIFADKNITSGFLNPDGSVNGDCITAIEFCEAEKLRREKKLNLILINVDGYSFTAADADNIKKLFKANGILRRDSVDAWTKLNENVYHSHSSEDCCARVLKGIIKAISKSEQTGTAATAPDFKDTLDNFFRRQFYDNMYLRLDDIAAGDGDSDNQVQIEKTFIDLYAVRSARQYGFTPTLSPIDLDLDAWSDLEKDAFRYIDRLPTHFQSDDKMPKTFAETVLSMEGAAKPVKKRKQEPRDAENSDAGGTQSANYGQPTTSRRNLILLGRAGQGKTTLMQYIALVNWAKWIKNEGRDFRDGEGFLKTVNRSVTLDDNFVPRITVKISLSVYDKYTSYITENNKSEELLGFDRYIEYLIWCAEKNQKPFGTKNNADERTALECWLEAINGDDDLHKNVQNVLCNTPVLISFDGLDEVKLNRRSVVDRIKLFVRNYTDKPGSNILTVTTTRKEKSEELKDRDLFTDYELINLKKTEVEKFVDKYIRAKWLQNAEEKIADIMNFYKQDEYSKLMQTPLEVTMICMVYNAYNSMPKSIETLYKRYVTMYIQRERQKQYPEEEKKQESKDFFGKPYTDNLINDFLNAIGFELEYNRTGVTEEQALEIAQSVNIDEDGDIKHDIDDPEYFKKLVDIVFTRLSFFDCDNTAFPPVYSLDNHHASVREYLAARYCVKNRSDDDILNFAQRVLIEQENTPQHWGIFRFLLELIIGNAKLVKQLLRKLIGNCTDSLDTDADNAERELCNTLDSTCFGAKISAKLICEEHIFDGRANYKRSLLQGALDILMLESTEDSDNLKPIINFARLNGLIDDVYLAIESKLSDGSISDNLIEAVALIAIADGQADLSGYPKLNELIESGDYLTQLFRRPFDATCYNDFKNSILTDRDGFEKLFGDLNKHGGSIDISLDADRPMPCKDREFFALVEMIRYLYLERNTFETLFSKELYDKYFVCKSDQNSGFRKHLFTPDPVWRIRRSLDDVTFCEVYEKTERLLYFYFYRYNKKADDAYDAYDALIKLCEKHGLSGTAAMLDCVKNFDADKFKNFAATLTAGTWDYEFFALFGRNARWLQMGSSSEISLHPTFIMVNRRLCQSVRTAKLDECAKLLFDIVGGKKLTLKEALMAFNDGLACRISMPNVSNSKHISLFEQVSKSDKEQLPFIFSGLEWKNRFAVRMSENDKRDRIHGTYGDAVKDKKYDELKPHLVELLGSGSSSEYHMITVLNFLLADPKCSPKELSKYSAFDIGKYSADISQELFYRYCNYNALVAAQNQYNIEQSGSLFHGCKEYKTIIKNLAMLALDSKDYFLYFKRALCMILNSQDFIINLDTAGLTAKYNNDVFMVLINTLKKWRACSDTSSQAYLSICGLIANYIVDCAKTDLFELPQETYTALLRFILNNFGTYSGTVDLVSALLVKIPHNTEFSSVIKEAQDYLAMRLKHSGIKIIPQK